MKKKENIPDTAINKPDKKKGLTKNEEVASNADKRIDQDFPGFPHAPSGEKNINPKTPEDKANANLTKKEEASLPPEDTSVGSANAFEATENSEVLRGESEQKKKDKKNKKTHY